MSITLPPLPYCYDALEPYLGRQTLEFHHDKHHASYVNNANKLSQGTELEGQDLVTIMKCKLIKPLLYLLGVRSLLYIICVAAAKGSDNTGLFNNAAQVWNHNFYWECMKPGGGGQPTGPVAELIDQSFGSYATFREQFSNAGNTQFGSGWAWLVHTTSGLYITKTINAENPILESGHVPILTMDVWEHAYYLDYQNARGTYVTAFLDHLVNWDFVNSQIPHNQQPVK